MYSSQNKAYSIPNSKSLETSCMSCHTTTPEILYMFILSLVLVLYKNTCNNSQPFPNILSTTEDFSSGFFSFSLLNQVLFLPIYNTPKSKSKPHFLVIPLKSNHLASLLSHHSPMPSFLQPASKSSFSSHLFATPKSPCQSLLKI